MTANLPKKWSVNLYPKNGTWQFCISYYDENNNRKQKWIDTGFKQRGNKRKAEAMRQDVLDLWIPRLLGKKAEESPDVFLANDECPTPMIYPNSIATAIQIPENERILFSEYLKLWLKESEIRYQITTYAEYTRNFNKTIIPYWEQTGLYLDEVKTKDINDFYCFLGKGVSANTVLRNHSYLHKAIQDAVNDDDRYAYMLMNPASNAKKPRHVEYIAKTYSSEEMARVFSILAEDFLFHIIIMDATYGMRRSELLGLTWSAIDFRKMEIFIKQAVVRVKIDGEYQTHIKKVLKNKSSYRSFEITENILLILNLLKERQKANKKKFGAAYNSKFDDFVFVDDMGNLHDPNYVSDRFRRALNRYNKDLVKKSKKKKGAEPDTIKVIRFHDLRHTCGAMLLDGGLSLAEIQKYLGHSQIQTTVKYTHANHLRQSKASGLAGEIVSKIQSMSLEVGNVEL